MRTKLLSLALLSVGLAACGSRSNTDKDDTTPTDSGTMLPPGATCPAGADRTVCDLKLPGGERQPAVGDPISLKGVVITTGTAAVAFNQMREPTLAGFYIQDRATTSELDDRYSGVAVTYAIGALSVPAVGSVVDIEGTYDEFSRDGATPQRQVKATFVSAASGTETVRVKELGIDAVTADYEGSVIRLTDVVATAVNPAGVGGMMIFGFQLNSKVIVSTNLTRYFARVGEEFNSVTGVYRIGTFAFDAGIYTLTPRSPEDISSKNPIERVTSIAAVQDPQSPDRPAEMCSSDQAMADRRCPKIALDGVVVTAVGGYVTNNLRSLWVQDPSVTDGRFAGIKVVYGKDDSDIPAAGDIISLEGEVILYFEGLQVQFPTFTGKSGTMNLAPVVVADPSMLARDSDPVTNPYEGVLVRIENVLVTERCIEDQTFNDRGDWIVTGNVMVSTAFMYEYNGMLRPAGTQCDGMANGNCSCMAMSRPMDMRAVDDDFASISGIMDFTFDLFRLQPRGTADLVLR